MAPPKTPAQIQADADALRLQEEAAAREDQQRRQSGIMDFLKGLIPDFSFFGLIEMALIFTGIYFLAKMPAVQGFIEKLVGNLSPEWQANILGLLNKVGIDIDMGGALEAMDHDTLHTKLKGQVSDEILDIIDPADGNKTLHEFLDVIRGANGGKVTLKGFTSPETITALIKQKPDMARALVVAAMKPSADGKPSSTSADMTASIKTLIAGPMLDDLLSPANRASALKVFAAALPAGTPISEDGLNAIITKGLDANGKPTDALRKLFNDAVDGKKDDVTTDVAAIVGTANMVTLVDPAKVTGEAAKYVAATLKQNPKAKAAQDALIAALGDAQAGAFLNALQSPDAGTQITKLLLTKENVHALPQAIALLNELPGLAGKLPKDQAAALNKAREFLTPAHIPAIINIVNNGIDLTSLQAHFTDKDGNPSIDRAVDTLLNPVTRDQLKNKVGTANMEVLIGDTNPMATKRNLDAIIRAADKIDGGNASPNSKLIMHRLAKLVDHTPLSEAFKGLSGAQLAAFFSVPANRAAFGELLNSIEIPANMPAAQKAALQKELTLLRKDYGKPGSNVGLGAILSDANSAQFLLDNDGSKPSSLPDFITKNQTVQALGMMWNSVNFIPSIGVLEMTGPLANGQNREILIELGKALGGDGATAPTPAPAKRTQPVQRHT